MPADKGALRLGTPAAAEVKASAETTGAIARPLPRARGARHPGRRLQGEGERRQSAQATLGELGAVEVAIV